MYALKPLKIYLLEGAADEANACARLERILDALDYPRSEVVEFNTETLPGADWVPALGADGGFCAVADASGSVGTYYMSYQQNYGVFRMRLDNTNGTLQSWTRVDPPGADTSLWLKPFILDPGGATKMFLAADDVLWRNSALTGIPVGGGAQTSAGTAAAGLMVM